MLNMNRSNDNIYIRVFNMFFSLALTAVTFLLCKTLEQLKYVRHMGFLILQCFFFFLPENRHFFEQIEFTFFTFNWSRDSKRINFHLSFV